MRALIVGAGIGGLATAVSLVRGGWEVEVRERAPDRTTLGTGLGIWPAAVTALDRLGLGDDLRRCGRPQGNGTIRRPDGSRIATIDADRIQRRTGEPVRVVARPRLLGLLHDALPPATVRFGAAYTAETPAELAGYDVVVGADGINSTVRRCYFSDRHGLRYAGLTSWRGVTTFEYGHAGETWGPRSKFGFTPQEQGRMNWYAARRVPEGYAPGSKDVDELRTHWGSWHDPIPRIIEAIETADVLRHSLHELWPPLPTYVAGPIVLIGDAAHAMTPDLGQGACQALIDGLVLGESLADAATVADGLGAYDRLRRRPTQRIAAVARWVGRLGVATHLIRSRDVAVRAALAVASPGG